MFGRAGASLTSGTGEGAGAGPGPGPPRPLLALGLLELAALAALGWLPGARATPAPALLLWAGAFAVYLAAASRAGRARKAGPGRAPAGSRSPSEPGVLGLPGRGEPGKALLLVWAVGLAARLLYLPLAPHFSDDIYRYLWDGWVQVQGVNPYAHSPADPALAHLRTAWHDLVNHPGVRTIYPPFAQVVFAALAYLGPSVLLFKGAWIVLDLGVAWAVGRIAVRRGRDPALPSLLYLWCPLPVLEVAWSGHLDPLGTLPMLLAVLVAARPGSRGGRSSRTAGWLTGTLLAGSAAVKFVPAAAVPALWRRAGGRAVAAFLLAALLLSVPYLDAGTDMLAGLTEYARRWSFHPGLHALLAEALGSVARAKWVGAAAVAAVSLETARRRWSLDRSLLWILGAGLLLSPTLHPWYVLWILPLAALRGSRGWILLAGTVALGYWGLDAFRATGRWPQPVWRSALIWIPPLALLLWDALRARRAGGPGSGE